MRVAVVHPSRGLTHSRTIEAILTETRDHDVRVFFAHGRPIPDCFNEPATEAIAWSPDWVWFVEEDMALPTGILTELASAGYDAVTADYPVTATGTGSVTYDDQGVVRYSGTGCLLIRPALLAQHLPFSTDHQYRVGDWTGEPAAAGAYGLHDVDFGIRLYTAGTPLHTIPTKCGQYRVTRQASPNTNTDGWQDVEVWTF